MCFVCAVGCPSSCSGGLSLAGLWAVVVVLLRRPAPLVAVAMKALRTRLPPPSRRTASRAAGSRTQSPPPHRPPGLTTKVTLAFPGVAVRPARGTR
ncbi:hypothetical protein AAFF_G00435420 [Aldrovandia affinis]|uniref:Uncharacterized protein n=1 Tax=Aldrovandia affinis TaxID=143900 RepID=A0AAD7S8G5_9TELE|nr:hypothetical protein AAFF_G00435420 [Aldrovandia affinis]